MNVAGLNRNIMLLQMDQSDASKAVREDIDIQRAKATQAKVDSLDKNQEAGELRGDAQDAQTRYQAVAASLTAAAACCAFIPYVGPVIAAVLLVIAAVFAILAAIEGQNKQQEAAKKEQQAGLDDIRSEGHKNRIEELKEDDKDRRAQLDNEMEKLAELRKESRENAKF